MNPPLFLQALDHATPSFGGEGWISACPICRGLLLVQESDGHWWLLCHDCSHVELVRWLGLGEVRTIEGKADDDLAWVTLMLATSPEIWQALRRGDPVNPEALEASWLRRFQRLGIV